MAIQGYDVSRIESLMNELLESKETYTVLVEERIVNGITRNVKINIDMESR